MEEKIEATGEVCPKCGKPMVIKTGRFGKFIACSDYPACKTTKAITTGVKCPECGTPFLVEKYSKSEGNYIACIKEGCGYKKSGAK
ncbi:MAG: topoisomerase DNA-binding C4 zinc finger domain-containing protein [Deltaproteobacteria bacterium]|nr:topoisomerase DNA-binding C4 zinc finger domain-containing protein [Deltaproteobacteria bacterium]